MVGSTTFTSSRKKRFLSALKVTFTVPVAVMLTPNDFQEPLGIVTVVFDNVPLLTERVREVASLVPSHPPALNDR